MANDHNLIPAKPGEVRNPNGKPKGVRNRATILREFMELKAKGVKFKNIKEDELPPGMTFEQAMNFKLMDVALDGEITAIKEIQDTLFGKLTDKIQNEHTFTQMGRVKIGDNAIEFDVGADPAVVPGSKEPD